MDTHPVPLRVGYHGENGLWMVSLWFRYIEERGVIECATGRQADMVASLESNDEVTFEASTNDPPYKGVRGRGTVSIEADEEKERLRDLLERYLGTTESELGKKLLSPEREEVRLVIEPERLHTWDFTGRM